MKNESETMTVKIGAASPDFTATAFYMGNFKTCRLSDYKGQWVVIFFYPSDFSFTCPTDIIEIAVKYSKLKSLEIQVLAIRFDTSVTHKIWMEEGLSTITMRGIPFPIISDMGGDIGQIYGLYDQSTGQGVNGCAVIDPRGIIRAMEALKPPVEHHMIKLIKKAKAFKHEPVGDYY
jgi:peroxiredoxin (alkyl hydroperoxide reductase subunit C)